LSEEVRREIGEKIGPHFISGFNIVAFKPYNIPINLSTSIKVVDSVKNYTLTLK
jgi:hypothetical protein